MVDGKQWENGVFFFFFFLNLLLFFFLFFFFFPPTHIDTNATLEIS